MRTVWEARFPYRSCIFIYRKKSIIRGIKSSRYPSDPKKLKNPSPNIAMAIPMGLNFQLEKMQTGRRVSIKDKAGDY